MFSLWKWELYLILSSTLGIFFVARAKNVSLQEKTIWIVSILIFNIIAILTFLIWNKKRQQL